MKINNNFYVDKKSNIVYKPIYAKDYDFIHSDGMFYKLKRGEMVPGHKFYTLLHIRPEKYNITLKGAAQWPKEQAMWGHDFLPKTNKHWQHLCIVNPLTVPAKYYNNGAIRWYRLHAKPSRALKPETRKHFGDILDSLTESSKFDWMQHEEDPNIKFKIIYPEEFSHEWRPPDDSVREIKYYCHT